MATTTPITSDVFTARFKDALWYKPFGKRLDVMVGGAGGIGSWLTLLLARMGHRISLIDNDLIDITNIGGQLYSKAHIGSTKVHAMQHVCSEFAPEGEIMEYPLRLDERDIAHRITVENHKVVFSAFDNMKARDFVVRTWMEGVKNRRKEGLTTRKDITVFIDGRMEAETGIIYCINTLSRYDRYMSEMFTDEEVPDNQCTFRATSHNPAILAGLMVGIFNNHIYNKVYGEEVREVPFKIEYELPTMTYTSIR